MNIGPLSGLAVQRLGLNPIMNGVFFTLTNFEGGVCLATLGFILVLGFIFAPSFILVLSFILILSAESKPRLVATKISVLGFF